MRLAADKSVEIVRIEDRRHRETVALRDRSEYRGYADYVTAVILDSVHRLKSALAGRNGRCKDEHMLALDHGLCVVTENYLSFADKLGRKSLNGLMRVEVHKAGVGELLR